MTIAKNDKFGIPHYTLLDKPNNESNVSMLDLTTWVIIAEHVEYSRHGVHMIQGLIHEISRIPICGANCEASLGDHKNCWMLTLPVSRDAIRGLGEKKWVQRGSISAHFKRHDWGILGIWTATNLMFCVWRMGMIHLQIHTKRWKMQRINKHKGRSAN